MSHVTLHPVQGRPRPAGYAEASSAGLLVTVAGQLPSPAAVAAGDFAGQFASALERTVEALSAAAASPRDIVHLRIYVTDLSSYEGARHDIGSHFRATLDGHYPPSTLVQVEALLGGAGVEIDALAVRAGAAGTAARAVEEKLDGAVASLRVRLAPADARYAGGLIPGSKTMELFGDLETEISLREGGDEGLCIAYDMVEFLAPLRVGDFVEATARVVSAGRSSRRIYAEVHKVIGADERGIAISYDPPVLAARAAATIVVGRTAAQVQRG